MEAQSQSEVEDCTVPEMKEGREATLSPAVVPGGGGQTSSVQAKVSGKARRKKRRLKHEPQSIFDMQGPSGVNVLDYFGARVTEVNSLQKALANKEGGKRVFQKLPRHMRRRAMSHNPKRLPRRLREAAAKEMETANDQAKKKPPSRKQRRKPSCMRSVYRRRQQDNVWLETHIWHAKRMKMVGKYGYHLAEHCSDKGVRAAHRSLVNGCLMSDISYYCCNEVEGEQEAIIASVSGLFHVDAGLTIRAKAYLGGQREGKAVLYKNGAYPYSAVAPVQFLWQAPPPAADGAIKHKGATPTAAKGKVTKLWIWCHPAVQKQVHSELQEVVKAYNCVSEQRLIPTAEEILANGVPVPRVPVSVTHRNLVRFHLVGPRSHALLMETLKPVDNGCGTGQDVLPHEDYCSKGAYGSLVSCDDPNHTLDMTESLTLQPAEKWWLGDQVRPQMAAHADTFAAEYPAIKFASDPSQFSRGTVVGMCVQDPRFFTPSKKTDMVSSYYPKKKSIFTGSELPDADSSGLATPVPDTGSPSFPSPLGVLPSKLAYSPIWNEAICKAVSKSKIPDHLLNQKRSEKLVKCSSLNLADAAPQIPVLLIQQSPGCIGTGHGGVGGGGNSLGTGWDLVLPPEWGMAFWVSLIYRGARACGLTELRRCSLESHLLHFPQDFPDTHAGQRHSSKQRRELENQYLKRPPNDRLNYGKLLVATPFHIAWEDLVRRWANVDVCESHPDAGAKSHPDAGSNLDAKSDSHPSSFALPVLSAAEDIVEASPCKKMKVESDESVDSALGGAESEVSSLSCDVGDFMESKSLPGEEMQERKCGIASSLVEVQEQCRRDAIMECRTSPNLYHNKEFYVLRSKEDLASLRSFIASILSDSAKKACIATAGGLRASMHNFDIDTLLESHSGALVAVEVEIHHSGTVNNFDSLSLPSLSDVQSVLDTGRSHPFSGPTEVVNKRGLTVVGKEGVTVGVSTLKREKLRELKKQGKKKNGATKDVITVDDFQLLPVKPSRVTIGHVTSAGYNYNVSLSLGVGFVTLGGLLEAVKCCQLGGSPNLLVLARGPSTKYYFVKLRVL